MYMYAALAEVEQFAVVTTAQPLVVNMYWEYPDTDVDSFTIIQCLKTSSHHCSVGGSVVYPWFCLPLHENLLSRRISLMMTLRSLK